MSFNWLIIKWTYHPKHSWNKGRLFYFFITALWVWLTHLYKPKNMLALSVSHAVLCLCVQLTSIQPVVCITLHRLTCVLFPCLQRQIMLLSVSVIWEGFIAVYGVSTWQSRCLTLLLVQVCFTASWIKMWQYFEVYDTLSFNTNKEKN